MTPAKNLVLFPEKAGRAGVRREKGTYGLIDNSVLTYQKRNGRADTRVLTALAEQANYRQKALTIPELMVQTELGQRAVEKALAQLVSAGLCVADGKAWRYGATNGRANHRANGCANDRASVKCGDAVQHAKSFGLKEVEGLRRNLKTYNNTSSTTWTTRPAPVGAAEANPTRTTTQGQAPDVAASDEAGTGHLNSFQVEPTHTHGGLENVTGIEDIPAAPAAPQTYREAQEVLTATGTWDTWAAWTKARRLDRAAQDAQIVQFATWAQAGLSTELRQNASEITAAGSYAHPYLALADRMKRAAKVLESEAANRDELRRTYGEPRCQPGERRLAPSGQVWTVDYVEYGLVYFAEPSAPMDQGDAIVARWPLDRNA